MSLFARPWLLFEGASWQILETSISLVKRVGLRMFVQYAPYIGGERGSSYDTWSLKQSSSNNQHMSASKLIMPRLWKMLVVTQLPEHIA